MYSHPQYNGSSSYPPFDHYLSQFTELELETSSFVGCGTATHHSGGSGCSSSYVSSPSSNSMGPATATANYHPPATPSCHLFQRSISSLSLHKGASSSLLGLPEDPLHDGPVRRAFSVGDLESVSSYMARRRRQRAESPLSVSNENTLIIEGIMKATKYSPEEKRERIERYRNKRNQRNFHKKIQYTCRKTLADSRPRVKGRFVRNDEISNIATTMATMDGNDSSYDGNCYQLHDQYSSFHHHQQQHMMMSVGADYEDNNWINLLDYSYPSQYEH